MTARGDRPILAVTLRDCLEKVVVRYHCDAPLARARLEGFRDFAPGTVEIQEFSRWVPTAKDAFKFVAADAALVLEGILGEAVLVARVGWLGTAKAADRRLLAEFEAFLLVAGFGDHLVRAPRRSAGAAGPTRGRVGGGPGPGPGPGRGPLSDSDPETDPDLES